jgi:hypothetical protein
VTVTAYALLALVPLAAGLCIWGLLTGGPGPEWRQEAVRQRPAQHSRRNMEQDTRRLTPPSAGWLPYPDRPGGEAQPLPPPEDLPWPRR